MADEHGTADFSAQEQATIRALLRARYAGVFPDQAVETHLRDYVGFPFADQMVPLVTRDLPPGARVLDLGCGFGAFTLRLCRLGFDCQGIDRDATDIGWARQRAAKVLTPDRAQALYRVGDATRTGLAAGTWDAVTCWNLLEHVPDAGVLFDQAAALLKPGGSLYLICPNYDAFRDEAHYLVPWRPLLGRRAASRRLRRLGKDPTFFEQAIFPRTNREVLAGLYRRGFRLHDLLTDERLDLRPDNLARAMKRLRPVLRLHNPLRPSILLRAVKGGDK